MKRLSTFFRRKLSKKTLNNFPRKKRRHNLFKTFTVDFVCRSIGEKFGFFFKNLPSGSQKKGPNFAKKLLENLLEQILLKL